MKARVLILSLMLSLGGLKAQHLLQGIPFDSTLYTGYYAPASGCTQTNEMTVHLDTALFHYASGIGFMIVVDSVHPSFAPSPIPNDTFRLSSATPTYSSLPTGPSFWFRIVMAGTPTTANQLYPCHIEVDQCTCFCLNLFIQPSPFSTTSCRVDIPEAITEYEERGGLRLYPNPVCTRFTVNGIHGKSTLKLVDSSGRTISQQEATTDVEIDTHLLAEGIYYLVVEGSNGRSQHKLVISR